MSLFKSEFHQELSLNPKLWASRFGIPEAQIRKLLAWEGTIHSKTAEKFRGIYAKLFKREFAIDDLFDTSCFKWADTRTVVHEFWVNPLSEEEKVGVFRYLFEKRFKALSVTELLALIALAIIIGVVIYVNFFASGK